MTPLNVMQDKWNKINNILFSIYFFVIPLVSAQHDSSFTQQVIKGISKYRTELMQKDSNGMIVLGLISKENKKLNWDEKSSDYQNFLPGLYNSESNFAKYNLKFLSKIYGDSSILTQFNIDILRVYDENIEMINCFRLDVLEDEYPFKIKKDSKFFKELAFYNIQDDETILILGASDYTIANIAYHIYNNLKVHAGRFGIDFQIISDAEQDSTHSMNTGLNKKISYFDWEASHKENEKLDRIIMRYVPEYFVEEKKYIRSLKENLRRNGRLFFLVPDPFLIEGNKQYKNAISVQEKLFKRLSQLGFVLEEDLVVGKLILYKFRINPELK